MNEKIRLLQAEIQADLKSTKETYKLQERLKAGEDSRHQFKEKFSSIDKLAVEISAFANSQGGKIIIGASDLGEVTGLSQQDINNLNQWISNATSQKIEPPLFVDTETLLLGQLPVLIINVPRGSHKPYCVNKSDYWVKNGADKRRATREELFRLMQSSSRLFADEMPVAVSIEHFDFLYFTKFYQTAFGEELSDLTIPREALLENLKLLQDKQLTLAGLLLFGKNVALHKPQFGIKGTVYLSKDKFRDKEDIGGNLFEQYKQGVDFILRNLHRAQRQGQNFNAPGELEIPVVAIKEAVANALAHRDYFINSSVFINIFADKVEITSPGVLPNTVTVENIKMGIHLERNPILLSLMAKDPDFGYTGRGSGIPRILRLCKDKDVQVTFTNDTIRNLFQVVFSRHKYPNDDK